MKATRHHNPRFKCQSRTSRKAPKNALPDGRPKGLQRVLEKCGFKVKNLKAKCSPVCPIDSINCCLAHLLSQQDDFKNQPSMLETLIKSHNHECIFLPKFYCELNPIEMASFYSFFILQFQNNYLTLSIVLGMVQIPLL